MDLHMNNIFFTSIAADLFAMPHSVGWLVKFSCLSILKTNLSGGIYGTAKNRWSYMKPSNFKLVWWIALFYYVTFDLSSFCYINLQQFKNSKWHHLVIVG